MDHGAKISEVTVSFEEVYSQLLRDLKDLPEFPYRTKLQKDICKNARSDMKKRNNRAFAVLLAVKKEILGKKTWEEHETEEKVWKEFGKKYKK